MKPRAVGYAGCKNSIEKVSSEIDLMIAQVTAALMNEKPFILLSKTNYNKLCIELKRNVRTYKGFKIRSM